MPYRPARPCLAPGCPAVVRGASRCPAHQLPRRPHTRSTAERGYGSAWQRLSAQVIARQPWCSHCGTSGDESNPLTADHILPLARGGLSTLDNLQTLCRDCNSRKRDRG